MPPFSFVLLGVLGFLAYKNRKNYKLIVRDFFLVTLLVSFLMNYGYFVQVGSFELAYDEFCTGVLFALCLPYFFKGKYDNSMMKLCIVFLVSCALGFLSSAAHPFVPSGFLTTDQSWDSYVFGYTMLTHNVVGSLKMLMIPLRFFLFFFVLSVLKENFVKEDWTCCLNVVLYVSKFMLLFGCIEFFLKNVFEFNFGDNIYNHIFGKGVSTFSSLTKRGDLYVLQGLFRETGRFAAYLFWLGFTWIIPIKKNPKRIDNYVWPAINLLLLPFTGSFAGIMYLALLAAFYVLYYCSRHKKAFIALVAVGVGVLLFGGALIVLKPDIVAYYWGRVQGVLDSITLIITGQSQVIQSSEYIRILSIVKLAQIWIDRFFFGIGFGVTWGHSALFWILACGGIVGLAIWGYFIFKKFIPDYKISICVLLVLVSTSLTQNLSIFYSFPYALVLFTVHGGHEKAAAPLLGGTKYFCTSALDK